MKYSYSSVPSNKWNSPALTEMFKNLKINIIDAALPKKNYAISRYNVLKNDGIVEENQYPHFDYMP